MNRKLVYTRRIRAERKDQGLCVLCGEPNDNPRDALRCLSCNRKAALIQSEKAKKLEASGRCVKCGKENDQKAYKVCAKCREKARLRSRRYYASRNKAKEN